MRVKLKFQSNGLEKSLPYAPVETPKFIRSLKFPERLPDLEPGNVSELIGKYTQLYAFANANLCRVNVEILRLETQLRQAKNDLFLQRPNLNGLDKWRRDTVIDSAPDVGQIKGALSRAEAEKLHHAMQVENFDRYLVALSRELTRKLGERDRPKFER